MATPSTDPTRPITDIARSASIRQALDGLLEGGMLLDFKSTYLYVNDAAARHRYQQREKLIGRSMPEMYPGVENSEVLHRHRITMEQRIPQRLESAYTFVDGTKQ
ncbi:MAG: PAS domain-containing protein [Gammaproteobacteria bacterium]|nr:PAS domain-containing protein [Gammaproteobacteria bacterium]